MLQYYKHEIRNTEEFNVATINIRVEDNIRDALLGRAVDEGVTLSDYVRDLLKADVIAVREQEQRDYAPEHITHMDRRVLSLLHRILGRVLPEDSNDVDLRYQLERVAVLEHGYSGEYWMEFAGMDTELTPQECGKVKDILDMFRITEYAITRLTEQGEAIDESTTDRLRFEGFDHNDPLEGQMSSYVEYLISQDKWRERASMYETPGGGNSHATMLPVYNRMLSEYRRILDSRGRGTGTGRYSLSADELDLIAAASIHPSNRP